MGSTYSHVIIFSLLGGVFSLIGGLLLLNNRRSAQLLAAHATPFAAGALLAAALLDLFPESLHNAAARSASMWMLTGIIGFFVLEYFFHWFHHHHEHTGEQTAAPLVIIGDTLHNFIDGIALGAAFLIDVPTGIVATAAVAAHEIPQEIGDFGLLLKYGYTKKRIILVNVLSALASTFAAVGIFAIGRTADVPVGALLAFTAGLFVYIAASDLIPTIHDSAKNRVGHASVILFIAGVALIGLTTSLAHEYIDVSRGDQQEGPTHVEEPGHVHHHGN